MNLENLDLSSSCIEQFNTVVKACNYAVNLKTLNLSCNLITNNDLIVISFSNIKLIELRLKSILLLLLLYYYFIRL